MADKKETLVFGYVRVSTDNQLENYSIEEQTDRIKAYCIAKGWTLLHIYTDGGFSGGNTNRPALQQMLKDIRSASVDAVVVYKLDRLSRSQKDTLTLIEDEFIASDTDFVSINENFDTSTPFGRAMIGILSVFAQLEKDQITERFTMGRIGRSKAGYFHGGGNAPTGYDYIDGQLIINEYEAIQVQKVFGMFLQGKSINAIWHELSEKYETKWTATKVSNVLKNSLYTGKVHFMDQEFDGIHQPLIDKATFTAANKLLTSADREARKTTAQKNPFRAGYLLSGLVYCGNCGAKYSANHGYYKCYSRAKSSARFIIDPNCKNDNWEIAKLDELIISRANYLINNASALHDAVENADRTKTIKVDKDGIKKRINNIESQIGKLIELYQLNTIPMHTLTARINGLTAEKNELEMELSCGDEIPAKELFLNAVEDYKTGFDSGDIDQKRMLLARIIERVTISGQSIQISWRL